jgi:beta-glucosidase
MRYLKKRWSNPFLQATVCSVFLWGNLFNESKAQNTALPFQNQKLSAETRAFDLVKRLTLEEKVMQMLNKAPAITRLGIPAYDWWNESLHGVARTEYNVTVYPQAIGMAAGWDPDAFKQMGTYVAEEGRAIYNLSIAKGGTGIYHGLTYWTPNINIFRDPRWGRGQETYGEDPFLTGRLGKGFVNGLQGTDPHYLTAAACAKHFAVHSGPESYRHTFNTTVSNYDLWDTYLPAFKELIVNAKVAGVMCAYNALGGQPCCGNDLLMTDILRNQWKFKGYVTSDCWAIDDFFKNHKTHKNAESAAADAVFHGTDLECGTDAYKALVQGVKDKLIDEEQINISVRRLFSIRFRLGLFDKDCKYNLIGKDALESKPHQQLALKMARQSIVLLKNEGQLLPLKKTYRKIAVIGPNADNETSVLGNYNGFPSVITTPFNAIKAKVGAGTKVYYEKATGYTDNRVAYPINNAAALTIDGHTGFKVEYFKNTELSGTPVFTSYEDTIAHRWPENGEVVDGIKANGFSARWTTVFTPDSTGLYSFKITGRDGYRLLVDGVQKAADWGQHGSTTIDFVQQYTAGKKYQVVLEFYQGSAPGRIAAIKMLPGRVKENKPEDIASRVSDADVIVFVGGISPELEGEEMPVSQTGFSGGDRTSITLPAIQTETLKALHATGKPVVLVLMTGSAIAMDWENKHIPAIVNGWYGGQAAGAAIADVIFGDYNPSGKLPVTFYKSDSDLPPFESYAMAGRTYRYFKGEVAYPFGFGLSYSKFGYSFAKQNIKVNAGKITGTVTIKNLGARKGDEVVQVYIQYPNGINEMLPLKELRQFNRISLSPGASKNVSVSIPVSSLKKWDEKAGKLTLRPGRYKVLVGPNSKSSLVQAEVYVH